MIKGRFPNTQLARYPRMSPEDAITWGKFLKEHGKEYDSFDYDLRVGQGVIAEANVPAKFIEDYKMLTQKRIDCVGYTSKGAAIFEVKQRAGLSALGQLNAYQRLFQETYPTIPIISLNLVCDFITDEERRLYETSKINVYLYKK